MAANNQNTQDGGRFSYGYPTESREPNSRGNREGGFSKRDLRSQQRAYNHQADQAFSDNWAAAPGAFEPRPKEGGGRQTKRSTQWKEKSLKAKEQKKPEDLYKARKETPPVNEPQWDLGPHTAGIPTREIYSQNYDFSGFVDLNERTYNQLRGIDPRLERRLPYSMFLHANTTVLNAVLLDTTRRNGENKVSESGMAQDILPEEYHVVGPIHEYMCQIGNTTTNDGDEVRFNLPDRCVPGVGEFRGHFGPVNAVNHNAYECYVAPYVTAQRVLASRRRQEDWDIPDITGALAPNENLLGYGPIDNLIGEALSRIDGFHFPQTDNLAGRLQYCPELMMRVNTVLKEYKDRFKVVNIGINDSGVRNYIKSKPTQSNLIFVSAEEDNELRLSINCHL